MLFIYGLLLFFTGFSAGLIAPVPGIILMILGSFLFKTGTLARDIKKDASRIFILEAFLKNHLWFLLLTSILASLIILFYLIFFIFIT